MINITLNISEQDIDYALNLFDEDSVITTIDNPYNPKKDYEKWLEFDHSKGYNTSELLDRLVGFDENDDKEVERRKYVKALLLILFNDVEGVYRLI